MAKKPSRSYFDLFLTIVERGGNLLPHPATLFAILAVAVIIVSAIASPRLTTS